MEDMNKFAKLGNLMSYEQVSVLISDNDSSTDDFIYYINYRLKKFIYIMNYSQLKTD